MQNVKHSNTFMTQNKVEKLYHIKRYFDIMIRRKVWTKGIAQCWGTFLVCAKLWAWFPVLQNK